MSYSTSAQNAIDPGSVDSYLGVLTAAPQEMVESMTLRKEGALAYPNLPYTNLFSPTLCTGSSHTHTRLPSPSPGHHRGLPAGQRGRTRRDVLSWISPPRQAAASWRRRTEGRWVCPGGPLGQRRLGLSPPAPPDRSEGSRDGSPSFLCLYCFGLSVLFVLVLSLCCFC